MLTAHIWLEKKNVIFPLEFCNTIKLSKGYLVKDICNDLQSHNKFSVYDYAFLDSRVCLAPVPLTI